MTSLRQALGLKQGGVICLVGAGGKTTLMFKLARELAAAGRTVLTTTTTKIFMPTASQSSCVILSDSADEVLKKAEAFLKKKLHISAAAGHLPEPRKLIGFQPDIVDTLWESGIFQWIIVEADGAAQKPLKVPAAHEPVIPMCADCIIGVVGLSAVGKPLTDQWVFRRNLFTVITGLAAGETVTESAIAKALVHEAGILKAGPEDAGRVVFLNQADVSGGLAAGQRIAEILIQQKGKRLSRVVIGQVLKTLPVIAYHDL